MSIRTRINVLFLAAFVVAVITGLSATWALQGTNAALKTLESSHNMQSRLQQQCPMPQRHCLDRRNDAAGGTAVDTDIDAQPFIGRSDPIGSIVVRVVFCHGFSRPVVGVNSEHALKRKMLPVGTNTAGSKAAVLRRRGE